MAPLKMFMADLTHTGRDIANDNMPLAPGLIAAYAKQAHGDALDIELFKYPEDLLGTLKREQPDILTFSNYVWNDRLNEFVCRKAKALYPDLITVKGGPNFPLRRNEQQRFLEARPHTDYYNLNEGELAFDNLIRHIMENRDSHKDGRVLQGVAYLHEGELVAGEPFPRMKDLEAVPSPYLNGMLDKFFDGKLIPIIETARGCPFSCNYCNAGYEYYTRMSFFDLERVKAELHYIGKKTQGTGVSYLIITDMDFGMFDRDVEIALEIKKCQELYDWPSSIYIETGKERIEKVSRVTNILKDCISLKMSIQSHNPEVLEEIRRKNIKAEMYMELCRDVHNKDNLVTSELIQPLPRETYESYMDGVEFLMDSKVDRIINYTLQLNEGTDYTSDSYIDQFSYMRCFRPYTNCYGEYEGEAIVESEAVGVATNTLSFNDYLQIRSMAFFLEVYYNHKIFSEVWRIIDEQGVNRFKFLRSAFDNIGTAPSALIKAVEAFKKETRDELFETQESMFEFFQGGNLKKLISGEYGRNVIFSNYSEVVALHLREATTYLFDQLTGACPSTEGLNELHDFTLARAEGVFAPDSETSIEQDLEYDFTAWMDQEERPLAEFRLDSPRTAVLYFDEAQVRLRTFCFNQYGCDTRGLARTVAKVGNFKQLLRKCSWKD